jgi:translation initiation factor 1 (eIF-1/SUI1)
MPPTPKLPACGFYVTLNPKDYSLPVRIKKVGKRKLTILSNITGSRKTASDTLKQIMGVGGEVSTEHPESIELQGDQKGRLMTTLKNLGALRGEPVQAGPTVVVPPKQGFEKFMKAKTVNNVAQIASEEMSKACIIVHGRYWPYCNGNCQHCPPLTDVFEGVDVYCSWYNPEDNLPMKNREKESSESNVSMTKEELDKAFAELGMRAEVGEAVRAFEKEKHMKPWLMKPVENKLTELVEIPKPAPIARPKKQVFVDRPVKVILNKPPRAEEQEDSGFFVMEITLVDHSMWMSEYEYFIVSLLAETSVLLANHEMIDSRTLKLLFYDKTNMLKTEAILDEVMPNFLEIKTSDALIESDEIPSDPEPVDEDSEVMELSVREQGPPDFERMTEELGLDGNEDFWRFFTHFIDQSDDSDAGVLEAFQKAVLQVIGQEYL